MPSPSPLGLAVRHRLGSRLSHVAATPKVCHSAVDSVAFFLAAATVAADA